MRASHPPQLHRTQDTSCFFDSVSRPSRPSLAQACCLGFLAACSLTLPAFCSKSRRLFDLDLSRGHHAPCKSSSTDQLKPSHGSWVFLSSWSRQLFIHTIYFPGAMYLVMTLLCLNINFSFTTSLVMTFILHSSPVSWEHRPCFLHLYIPQGTNQLAHSRDSVHICW